MIRTVLVTLVAAALATAAVPQPAQAASSTGTAQAQVQVIAGLQCYTEWSTVGNNLKVFTNVPPGTSAEDQLLLNCPNNLGESGTMSVTARVPAPTGPTAWDNNVQMWDLFTGQQLDWSGTNWGVSQGLTNPLQGESAQGSYLVRFNVGQRQDVGAYSFQVELTATTLP